MKKNGKNLLKHLSTIGLFTFFGILALGSSSTKKGIKAYKKGNYEIALKELKGTTTNGSADFIDEYWYLGLTYEAMGDFDNAEMNKSKAFNIYQKDSSEAKDFKRKYPSECSKLLEYGKKSGYDRTDPKSYHLKNLQWYETYRHMGRGDNTNVILIKIALKIHSFKGGTCEVWDNSNHTEYAILNYTDQNIGNQLKEYAANGHAFMAYCELKGGMLYVNFIDNQ